MVKPKTLEYWGLLIGSKGRFLKVIGQAIIKKLVGSCSKIEKLLLFFNEIDKIGAAMVPEMLNGKTLLTSLELNGNIFDGDGEVAESIREKLSSMGKSDVLDELDEMESEEGESSDDEDSEGGEQDTDDLAEIAQKVGGIKI